MTAPNLRTATPSDLLARQREAAIEEAARANDALVEAIRHAEQAAQRVREKMKAGAVDASLVSAADFAAREAARLVDAVRVAVAARERAERAGARF